MGTTWTMFEAVRMERKLNCGITLPLQEMTLNRIAIILWTKPDVLASIVQLDIQKIQVNLGESRKIVECKVRDKIPELGLPDPLMQKLIPILKLIGSEIIRWKYFHQEYFALHEHMLGQQKNLGLPVLEKLLWTSTGTVDNRNTAAALVRSDVLGIEERYKLACVYCLQDCIPELWNELPEVSRKSFYNKEAGPRIPEPHMYLCWPYILRGEESKLDDVPMFINHRTMRPDIPRGERYHLSSFRYSSFRCHKTVAEYCFQNLTVEERKASLVETAVRLIRAETRSKSCSDEVKIAKTPDMLCYLLSQMTPIEQMKIFKELPCEVLRCFMEWPWHHHFSEIADIVWDLIPASKYKDLFYHAGSAIQNFGYYIPSLLQNLLRRSPKKFAKLFVDKSRYTGYFFKEIFDNKDTVTLKIIFGNLEHAHRAKLVLNPCVLQLFNEYYSKGDSHMVECCIRMAELTEKETKALQKFPVKLQGLAKYFRCINATVPSDESDSSSDDSSSDDSSSD